MAAGDGRVVGSDGAIGHGEHAQAFGGVAIVRVHDLLA